jgi:hypothetical protein
MDKWWIVAQKFDKRRRKEVAASHLEIGTVRCNRPVRAEDSGPPNIGGATYTIVCHTNKW